MKYLRFCVPAIALFASMAFAEEDTSQAACTEVQDQKREEILKLSEAFGFLMGKNIDSMGVKFDIDSFVKGLQDAAAGKAYPMTELECIEAITAAQEAAFKEKAELNLSAANIFLKENSLKEGIVSLEEGKVQYKIEKTGSGSPLQESNSPLVRYTGKFLDGSVFGSSLEDEPLALEEIISGLKAGMLGMKEGEKRTIYIHPDCAYGTKGSLPPNSLLTFEIEIIRSEAPMEDSPLSKMEAHGEIALPEQETIDCAR
jgi:peptidylprolyl isomerase